MDRQTLRERLMATFLGELEEHVHTLTRDLLAIEQTPAQIPDRLASLFRSAHSLKGAARSVNLQPIETVCHHLESLLGRPVLFKQSEKHDGPHAAHFWDVDRSGGGVTMDMGCHAIQFFRWLNANNPVKSVYAQMNTSVHASRTRGEDNAIIILEFDNGVVALAEESWTKRGGMDDRAEIHGSEGVAYADLLHGNAIPTYSAKGVGYAVEKAGSTIGWSFVMYEEIWNYGFPQEFQHFVDCVRHDREPLVTGADGKAVLEILFAAYESAGSGRKIVLPSSTRADKPYDLWKKR